MEKSHGGTKALSVHHGFPQLQDGMRHRYHSVTARLMTMRPIVFRFLVWFPLIVVGLSGQPGLTQAETAGEYQVKAAFFYHFANFVDWPHSTFTATKGHFRICVMGQDPFGPTLEATLSKKSVRDHPFEILRNPPSSQLQHCHMLYLPASATSHILTLRPHIAKEDVLTVGETLDFMKQGGMVQFFLDDQKVQFAVNTDVVDQTQLKFSSKLLRLAKIYKP